MYMYADCQHTRESFIISSFTHLLHQLQCRLQRQHHSNVQQLGLSVRVLRPVLHAAVVSLKWEAPVVARRATAQDVLGHVAHEMVLGEEVGHRQVGIECLVLMDHLVQMIHRRESEVGRHHQVEQLDVLQPRLPDWVVHMVAEQRAYELLANVVLFGASLDAIAGLELKDRAHVASPWTECPSLTIAFAFRLSVAAKSLVIAFGPPLRQKPR